MLELWGMRSTPSLPSLLGLIWLGVVEPDRSQSIGQIEVNCVVMLNWIPWNRTLYDIETLLYKTEFFEIEMFWHLTGSKQNLYLY